MTDLPLDRREFHTSLAKGAALIGLAGAPVLADDKKPNESDHDKPVKADPPKSPAALIVELTQATYPHENMSDDFLAALKSYVALNLSYSETLDNFGLTNGDPPGPIAF